jgi:hypothetical protein
MFYKDFNGSSFKSIDLAGVSPKSLIRIDPRGRVPELTGKQDQEGKSGDECRAGKVETQAAGRSGFSVQRRRETVKHVSRQWLF